MAGNNAKRGVTPCGNMINIKVNDDLLRLISRELKATKFDSLMELSIQQNISTFFRKKPNFNNKVCGFYKHQQETTLNLQGLKWPYDTGLDCKKKSF